MWNNSSKYIGCNEGPWPLMRKERDELWNRVLWLFQLTVWRTFRMQSTEERLRQSPVLSWLEWMALGGQGGWRLRGRNWKEEDVKICSLGLTGVCVRESLGQERKQQMESEAKFPSSSRARSSVANNQPECQPTHWGHWFHVYQLLEAAP